ncbi:unnamed protein product [Oikopleura dioica]|uniref:Uncharacterized protein n=1 Tax=Oikopleura dioica TaxID=34765 RepID=E4XA97_OIKDI|nr:unnamed protein product [Oikopleura dioica]
MSREEHDLSLKILLIGDSGAGKTSLLLRYSNNKFESSMIATIGIDFKIKTIVVKGKRIKLQVWDTAGAERFRTMTQSYYRGSNGIMLVFDIMSEKSFENISYWLESIQTHAPEEITAALVGAKCDCEEKRAVSQLRAQRFADQNRIIIL